MTEQQKPCTHVLIGRTNRDNRACSKDAEHEGPHDYSIKPTADLRGWEDGK